MLYRDLLAERCRANRVACWAYCLMPNHVHLIMTPSTADGIYSDTLLNPHSLKGSYGDSAFISSAIQRSLVQRKKCTVTSNPAI